MRKNLINSSMTKKSSVKIFFQEMFVERIEYCDYEVYYSGTPTDDNVKSNGKQMNDTEEDLEDDIE